MTDTTTSTSTLPTTISLTAAPYRDRTGQRGRPQKHPQVAIDLSGAPKAVEEHGEKKVRNDAFRKLRAALGVDAKVPCCEHPKDETIWILKAELADRQDYLVTVTDAE